jgi:hypothetical protein
VKGIHACLCSVSWEHLEATAPGTGSTPSTRILVLDPFPNKRKWGFPDRCLFAGLGTYMGNKADKPEVHLLLERVCVSWKPRSKKDMSRAWERLEDFSRPWLGAFEKHVYSETMVQRY